MVIDHFFGHYVGGIDHLFGGRFVAGFPKKNMVVMFAFAMGAAGLASKVLTQYDGVRLKCFERIGDYRQFFVLNLDQLDCIGVDIAIFGDDKGDFLTLEQHFTIGQHHLFIPRQRRHPMQAERFKVFGCEHGNYTGQGHCLVGVD